MNGRVNIQEGGTPMFLYENVKVDDNILDRQKLNEWQKELFGIIKDPSYTYFSTIGKQANLNYTTEKFNMYACWV